MVADTGTTPRPSGIRSLNAPRPVRVDVGEDNLPVAIGTAPGTTPGTTKDRKAGVPVSEVLDSWRIDDEWWRKQPVSRLYYRVALEDGTMTGLFQDLVSGRWYQQQV